MKKILLILLTILITISCCDKNENINNINPPNDIINNYYYKHFNIIEAKEAVAPQSKYIKSIDLTFHFMDNNEFEISGYYIAIEKREIILRGTYEYNSETGKINLNYYQRYYEGVDLNENGRNKGIIKGNYLKINRWKFKEKNNNLI